jgi:hypothetical protein
MVFCLFLRNEKRSPIAAAPYRTLCPHRLLYCFVVSNIGNIAIKSQVVLDKSFQTLQHLAMDDQSKQKYQFRAEIFKALSNPSE